MDKTNKTGQLNRWRLILGGYSQNQLSFGEGASLENGISCMDLEEALDFLYNREQGEDVRQGGTGASRLTAATWITRIRKLFPKETVEILERHALDNYGMTELLTDKEVLEKLEPNQELLKTILQLKHLMKGDVLDAARRIVKKVAEEIAEKLNQDIRRSLLGKVDRNSQSPVRSIRNLDIQKTIRRNLKHYDAENGRLMLEQVYFNGRTRRYSQWRVIIAVDESGVLRMDLGGSSTYTLSCIESSLPIPDPQQGAEQGDAQTPPTTDEATSQQPPEPAPQPEPLPPTPEPEPAQRSVPIWPLTIFLMGLAAGGGCLAALYITKRNQQGAYEEWEDDEEE